MAVKNKKENSLELLGNKKIRNPCCYNELLLNCGMIWNRMELWCGGGGGSRTRATKLSTFI